MNPETKLRLSNPLAGIGTVFAVFGGLLFFFLLALDIGYEGRNPYTALLNFFLAPAVVVIGVGLILLSFWLQVRAAHRRGERVTLRLSIDTSSPNFRRALYGTVAALVLGFFIVGYSGVKGVETVASVDFCGKACHHIMGPQYAAYQHSPHARVACVDCHVGPGFEHWIKSKLAAMRQLTAVATSSYQRPIPTPVHSLRPAQETCESCHWPRQFYGRKFVTHTYYKTDEQNSPWTVDLLVKIGGGNPRTGKLEGIHWHMLEANTIEYIAVDEERQQIPWVRVTDEDGGKTIFTQDIPGQEQKPDPEDPGIDVRRFDCMDCHNRPSHQFVPPANAVNLAMSQGRISTELPYVRKKAVDLMVADYDSHQAAAASIPMALTAYYEQEYPEIAKNKAEEIDKAADTLVRLYEANFFPEMKTDYRTRLNNLSHFTNLGCFRCHNGKMANDKGEPLEKDCTTCHLIVAQGPSVDLDELQQDIGGLEFKHPVEIGEAWKQLECTNCHTRASGY